MSTDQKFTLAEAKMVDMFVATLLYGVYLVTAGLCIRVLLQARRSRPLRYIFFGLVVFMFILATIDVAIDLQQVMQVFVYYRGPNSADEEFENLSSWVNITETVIVQMLSLIGDGILVYRCFIIFTRRWTIIVLPTILWIASGVIGILIVYFTASVHTGDIITSTRLAHSITIFLCVTLVENLLTTGLIVWRIHRIDKDVAGLVAYPRPKRSPLAQATRIIVESGLLYTIVGFLALVTELAGSNAAYPASQMLLMVTGISFNLIIIRVGNGSAVSGNEATTTTAAGDTHIQLSPLPVQPASVSSESNDNKNASLRISEDADRV